MPKPAFIDWDDEESALKRARRDSKDRLARRLEFIDAELKVERTNRREAAKDAERALLREAVEAAQSRGVPGSLIRRAMGLTSWAEWTRVVTKP